MTSSPLVSILINNFNYGPFLGEAIESALSQTYHNVEVVVVDDGSTDNSREVIASYGDAIIAVVKENGGQASAFNAGFAASSGDVICFLDSDDLFLPQKASQLVKIFQDNPQIGWCFDRVHEFDHKTGQRSLPPASCKFGEWDARKALGAGRAPFIPTATSGLSFQRDTLARILPMPERFRITSFGLSSALGWPSDGYLKLLALALEKGWMVSEELTRQRIHGDNAYTKRSKGKKLIVGRTGLLTSVCVLEQFPELRRLAIKLFSFGLGICCIEGGLDADCRQLTRLFLRRLSLRTRAEVLTRAVYWSGRHLLSHWMVKLNVAG